MKVLLAGWHSATAHDPRQGAYGLDDEADIEGARLVCRMAGGKIPGARDAKTLGVILHFAFGASTGALYALLLPTLPAVGAGCGSVFGTAVWLIGDEAAVALSGISDPRRKALMSHVMALLAHVLFGVVTDLSLKSYSSRPMTKRTSALY